MTKPKYTKAEVEAELAKLDGSGFKCSVYYLKTELLRRARSSLNPGRKIENDSKRHEQWREASRRLRESKGK